MIKKSLLFVLGIAMSIQLISMELTRYHPDPVIFWQQAPLRKKVIFPLIAACTDYNEIKNNLHALQILSKQSYEQINCISFTADLLRFISQSRIDHHPELTIATLLKTHGTYLYKQLSDKLFLTIIDIRMKKRPCSKIRHLLEKGADINVHARDKGETLLMKAVQSNDIHLVRYCIQKGAKINDTNTQGVSVREHNLLLYNSANIQNILIHLNKMINFALSDEADGNFYKKNRSALRTFISSLDCSQAIRNAVQIDKYLEKLDAVANQKNALIEILELTENRRARSIIRKVFSQRTYIALCALPLWLVYFLVPHYRPQ